MPIPLNTSLPIQSNTSSNEDIILKIIEAVNNRCNAVLQVNNLSADIPETKSHYEWVKGIYDDAILVVSSFK
jgi:hypothetical protein